MDTLDISDTIAPNSDQLDAVDLLSGPRVFTIERVSKGSAEQPVQLHLAAFPRPWRPGKSMRRVLVRCWGKDASVYVGRRVELFCDAAVVFGGQAVGGTRIRRMSHIDERMSVPLLVSRGKSSVYTVEPLGDEPSWSELVDGATTREELLAIRGRAAVQGVAAGEIDPLLAARAATLSEPHDTLHADPDAGE